MAPKTCRVYRQLRKCRLSTESWRERKRGFWIQTASSLLRKFFRGRNAWSTLIGLSKVSTICLCIVIFSPSYFNINKAWIKIFSFPVWHWVTCHLLKFQRWFSCNRCQFCRAVSVDERHKRRHKSGHLFLSKSFLLSVCILWPTACMAKDTLSSNFGTYSVKAEESCSVMRWRCPPPFFVSCKNVRIFENPWAAE